MSSESCLSAYEFFKCDIGFWARVTGVVMVPALGSVYLEEKGVKFHSDQGSCCTCGFWLPLVAVLVSQHRTRGHPPWKSPSWRHPSLEILFWAVPSHFLPPPSPAGAIPAGGTVSSRKEALL